MVQQTSDNGRISGRTKIYILIFAVIILATLIFALVFKNITDGRAYEKYIDAAEMSRSSGDYDNALSLLRKAASIDQTDDCLYLMAVCYDAQGNYEKALETLRTMDTTNPSIQAQISTVEAKRRSIEESTLIEIGGVKHDINETSLVLDGKGLGNGILSEVSRLYAMSNLSLANNGITDVSAISGLRGLTTLNLSGNSVSDLSPLAGLTGLRTLYLDNNPISDFTPLYSLTSLTTLSVKGIEISSSVLQSLSEALPDCAINGANTRTETPIISLGGITFDNNVEALDLSGKGLMDISALAGCTALKTVNLSNNYISDITPLMDIPTLTNINISGNSVKDLRPLMGLTTIQSINASNNRISTTVPLGAITSLTELNLSGNQISDFSGIRKLKNLANLNLSATGLKSTDIPYFTYLSRLISLNVEDNNEITGQAYEQLTQLLPTCSIQHSNLIYLVQLGGYTFNSDARSLELSNAGVNDISNLYQFTNLETVHLAGNGIFDISSFNYTESWRTLTDLDLSSNYITDITPLAHLTEIRTLNLSYNSIYDITPLLSLQNLRTLYIMGNSMSEEQIYILEISLPNCNIIWQ